MIKQVQDSVTFILQELFERQSVVVNAQQLIQHFFAPSNFAKITNKLESQVRSFMKNQFQVMNTAKIMLTVLQYIQTMQSSDQRNEDDVVIEPTEVDQSVLDQMAGVVERAVAILAQKSQGEFFSSTFGQKQQAFGSGKIKLLEVVHFSFKVNFN